MKTHKQQILDALWYLKKPGQSPEDEAEAIKILSDVVGKKIDTKPTESVIKDITGANYPTMPDYSEEVLKGVFFAIMPGHEPGGGAQGERAYNIVVGHHMKEILESYGATVFYYEHRTRSYGRRQDEAASAVKAAYKKHLLKPGVKKLGISYELHYDAVSSPSPSGHHFQYLGAKELASFIRDGFQARFPHSQARRDNGIMRNARGNGAGYLRKSPLWAVLTEPFFISNPAEKAFYADKQHEIALIYCAAGARFSKLKLG